VTPGGASRFPVTRTGVGRVGGSLADPNRRNEQLSFAEFVGRDLHHFGLAGNEKAQPSTRPALGFHVSQQFARVVPEDATGIEIEGLARFLPLITFSWWILRVRPGAAAGGHG
jgi:hypothetical protein